MTKYRLGQGVANNCFCVIILMVEYTKNMKERKYDDIDSRKSIKKLR